MGLANLLGDLLRRELIDNTMASKNLVNLPAANTHVFSELSVGQSAFTVQLDRHGFTDDMIKVIQQGLVEVVRDWNGQSHLKTIIA